MEKKILMRKSLVPLPFQSLRLERILWDGEKKRNESMERPDVYRVWTWVDMVGKNSAGSRYHLALSKLAIVYKELYFSVLPAVLSEALLQEQPDHRLSRANCTHLCCKDLQWCHLSCQCRVKATSLPVGCKVLPAAPISLLRPSPPASPLLSALQPRWPRSSLRPGMLSSEGLCTTCFSCLEGAPHSPKSHLSLLKCDLLEEVFMTICLKLQPNPNPPLALLILPTMIYFFFISTALVTF